MEKQPHQEYRDDLADKLKKIRNSDQKNPEIAKSKAQGYLAAKQETEEYQEAREIKLDKLSFEFGHELGKEDWYGAILKKNDLNERMGTGENRWRFPSEYDWLEVFKAYKVAEKACLPKELLEQIIQDIKKKHGLEHDYYWLQNDGGIDSNGNGTGSFFSVREVQKSFVADPLRKAPLRLIRNV